MIWFPQVGKATSAWRKYLHGTDNYDDFAVAASLTVSSSSQILS